MNNLFDLSGKKAIVVGGAGDLGVSMLEALLAAGAEAVSIDISDQNEKYVASFKEKGYIVYSIIADISDRTQIRQSYAKALEYLNGHLDILVNAAGIQIRHKSEEFPEEDWDKVLAVNLSAVFFYCQLAGNTMIRQRNGKIINIASIQSYCGGITIPAYVASKGGVGQLTKELSNDWGEYGININSIAPGYMATKLNTALMNDPHRTAEIMARIPQKRWGTGEDLKGITVFLASAASDYVNGTVIPVDGGYLGR